MMFPKPSQVRRKRHDVVDGVRYVRDKVSGLLREVCITTEARERRRREVFEASRDERGVYRCKRCRCRITWEFFHWHHSKYKGMGGANNDDSLANSEALCDECHDKEHNKESLR